MNTNKELLNSFLNQMKMSLKEAETKITLNHLVIEQDWTKTNCKWEYLETLWNLLKNQDYHLQQESEVIQTKETTVDNLKMIQCDWMNNLNLQWKFRKITIILTVSTIPNEIHHSINIIKNKLANIDFSFDFLFSQFPIFSSNFHQIK